MSDLYSITVPTLRRYVTQIGVVLDVVEARPEAMSHKVADDVFSAGRQLSIAMGFALRATYPVMGKETPDIRWTAETLEDVRAWQAEVTNLLATLTPDDFENPPTQIRHKAGHAELSQDPFTYVTEFALPNFFFHMVAGYTALRATGLPLSKGDFDGLHDYPRG